MGAETIIIPILAGLAATLMLQDLKSKLEEDKKIF